MVVSGVSSRNMKVKGVALVGMRYCPLEGVPINVIPTNRHINMHKHILMNIYTHKDVYTHINMYIYTYKHVYIHI